MDDQEDEKAPAAARGRTRRRRKIVDFPVLPATPAAEATFALIAAAEAEAAAAPEPRAGTGPSPAPACDRAWLRNWCERILAAAPGDAREDSDICETVMTKTGPVVKLCDKMAAFDRLTKLCGYNEPEKMQHDVAGIFYRQLAEIRSRKRQPQS